MNEAAGWVCAIILGAILVGVLSMAVSTLRDMFKGW